MLHDLAKSVLRAGIGLTVLSNSLAVVPLHAQARQQEFPTVSTQEPAAVLGPGIPSARMPNVPTENKRIIAKAVDDYNAGKAGMFELMAPNLIWTIEGTGIPAGTYHSRQAFLDGATMPLVSRLRTRVKLSVRGLWADGDDVILNFDGDAIARDGKPFHTPYVWILTMRNGRIIKGTAFLDLRQYDRVIRHVRPKP